SARRDLAVARGAPRTTARGLALPRRELARIDGERPLDIRCARLPVRDRDADRGPAVPRRPAHPRRAVLLNGAEHPGSLLVVGEPEQDLVQLDVVQHFRPELCQAFGKPASVLAATLDDLLDARAAERAYRRVDREPARAARVLGVPVELVACLCVED